MSRCSIVFNSFAIGPNGMPIAGIAQGMMMPGATTTFAQCDTHHYPLGQVYGTTTADQLCPIGRVEEAVDAGLAKIKAAMDGLEKRTAAVEAGRS